jgi:uncharacterized protein (TIGR03437 family)
VYPYTVRLAPASSMSEGTYTGTLTTSGSSVPAENKSIPVTMRVTKQPIGVPSVTALAVRLAQGAPPLTTNLLLSNVGQGTLAVTGATVTGGSWLTATSFAGGAVLKIDPGSLPVGTNSGSVTLASNAVNGAVTVPVDFEVVAKGAPTIDYQGVVDNATFVPGEAVSGGSIVAVKGDQLTFTEASAAPPLPTQVGGAKVLVNGLETPMFYSLYRQLAFQMPYTVAPGTYEVQVERDGVRGNKVSLDVVTRAPRILMVGATPWGVVTFPDFTSFPFPAGTFPGITTRPARAGDTLIIWAIGLGPTSPQPAAGAPAPATEPLARLTNTPTALFGNGIGAIPATPQYAGLAANYAGLYQVNVTVPANTAKGLVNLRLVFGDAISNAAQIAIE